MSSCMGPGLAALQSEEEKLLTSLPSSPAITQEAARTQRSLAVDTGTPAIPVPNRDADLEPPPKKPAESPTHQSPKQVRAPTEVRGASESLRSEAPWSTMGQMSPASARAPEPKIAQ